MLCVDYENHTDAPVQQFAEDKMADNWRQDNSRPEYVPEDNHNCWYRSKINSLVFPSMRKLNRNSYL